MKADSSDRIANALPLPPRAEVATTLLVGPIAKPRDDPPAGLFWSTLIITFFSGFKIALGFALQMVLAAKFGARMEMDAYLAASTVPTLITTVLLGSLNVTFIPVFVEYKIKKNEAESWRIASSFIDLAFFVLAAMALTGILGANWLVRLTVPGFGIEGEAFTLTANLLRVLFPSIVFSGLAGLLSSVYYSQRKFTLPSLAPALNGLVILLVTLGLASRLGVVSVAVGTLVGSVAQFGLLLPIMLTGKRYHFQLDYRHPGVVKIAKLMLPLVLGAVFYKANAVVDRFIASGLPEGSISYLGYAFKVANILVTLAVQGFAVSLLPLMSEYAAANDSEGLRKTASMGVRLVIFVVTPLVVGVAMLRVAMIRLLFERGAFDHRATVGTAWALLCYLGWVYAGGIGAILTSTFYSLQETYTVIKVGVTGMLLEIVLAIVLSRFVGYAGLSLALSVVAVINGVVFMAILRKRLKGIDGKHILSSQVKVLFSSIIMAGVLLVGTHFVQTVAGSLQHLGLLVLSISVPTTVGVASYFLVAWLLSCEEVIYLSRWLSGLRGRIVGEDT